MVPSVVQSSTRQRAPWAFASRLRIVVARWVVSVRRAVRIRRGVHVDGIYYKELTPESLERSLSRRGPGFKDYRVRFPDGSKQVIRCSMTSSREGSPPGAIFADLMGSVGIGRLEPLIRTPTSSSPASEPPSPALLPGDRVLELGSGSGYRAVWLSYAVGPSGGVVALTHSRELVQYAQKRYVTQRPNIAFELAETFGLSGETDGSFNAVVAMDVAIEHLPPSDAAQTLLRELWRLVVPGGVLLLGSPIDERRLRAAVMHTLDVAPSQIETTLSHAGREGTGSPPVTDLMITKPYEAPRPPTSAKEPPESPHESFK